MKHKFLDYYYNVRIHSNMYGTAASSLIIIQKTNNYEHSKYMLIIIKYLSRL